MPDPVSIAQSLFGTPYKFGGDCPAGTDCSGLVYQVYNKALPRTAAGQYQATSRIDPGSLQRGDLVFLQNTQPGRVAGGQASHVGIYDGAGNVIAAPHTGGVVGSTPLSQWLRNPNFLGAGRVAGQVSQVVQGNPSGTFDVGGDAVRRAGVSAFGGLTGVLPSVPNPLNSSGTGGNYGGLLDDTGDLDFQQLFLRSLAQQPSVPSLYNPNAPSLQPNPTYDPSLYGPPQGNEFFPQLPTGPSDLERMQQFQTQGLAPSNAYLQQAEHEKATAALFNARAKWLQTHPAAQQEIPQAEPLPQQQFAPIPNRPAPQLDPAAALISSLAGVVAPRFAGTFGAQPLQAGIQVANQEYQDNLRRYQLTQQQLTAQYEHDLMQHNENRKNALYASDVNFANQQRQRDAAQAAMEAAAQGGAASQLAQGAQTTGEQQQGADLANLRASQVGQQIQTGLGMNQIALSQYQQQVQQHQDFLKALLGPISSQQASSASAQSAEDLARLNNAAKAAQAAQAQQNQFRIATMHNQTLRDIAQGHDTARVNVANINNQVNGLDPSQLSPLDRIQFQALVTRANNSAKAVQAARNQAARMYATDANRPEAMSTSEYQDNYSAGIMTQAKLDAQAAQDFYTQHKTGAAAPPAGIPGLGAAQAVPTAPALPPGVRIIGPNGIPFIPK